MKWPVGTTNHWSSPTHFAPCRQSWLRSCAPWKRPEMPSSVGCGASIIALERRPPHAASLALGAIALTPLVAFIGFATTVAFADHCVLPPPTMV